MNRRIITLLLLLITAAAAGQMPAPAGKGKDMAGKMNAGKLYGKLVDAKTGKPVATAPVMLMKSQYNAAEGKAKQVLVKGVLSADNGDFSLEELPVMGEMELTVSAIGYKPFSQKVSFNIAGAFKNGAPPQGGQPQGDFSADKMGSIMDAVNKDLGNLKLTPDNNQLKEVTVTASTPAFTMQGEKKIFNVDKNITSQGGTAQDVMKNVPGVLVDADGNLSLRNSPPQILVDGKPTSLTLDQIPSDAIESVEVVTNPSAKYDAESGAGGVVNIVLKKNKKKGYNGNIRAGADSRGGINGGGDFNIREGKFNVSASVNGRLNRSKTFGSTDRNDFYGDPYDNVHQDNTGTMQGGFMFSRLGLDYFITNRTTLSLSAIKMMGTFSPDEDINIVTDSLFSSGDQRTYAQRHSSVKNHMNNTGIQLGMKHLFPKEGMEWTVDGSANLGHNTNNSVYTTNYFANGFTDVATGGSIQKTTGSGKNNFFTLQSDFTYPFSKKTKLETGVKATIRNLENYNSNSLYDSASQAFIELPTATSNYKNTEQIYAAYATLSGNLKSFSYQLGLRAENSRYDGELTNTGEKFSNSYPVSLFPSVFISRKLGKDQDLQLSYRRGITRPNFFQLLPFTDYTDNLNISRGNPDLKPEFTNTLELSYMHNFGRNYLLGSVYYKHAENLITRYQETGTNPVTGQETVINTYVNANSSDKYGVELTAQWYLTKWWDVLGNVNIYNSVINTDNIAAASDNNAYWSWFGKLNNNFKLPKNFSIQLSGIYQSKTNLPPDDNSNGPGGGKGPGMQAMSASQGYIAANYSIDLAIRKSFLKDNAASVSLSINDIFRTRTFTQYSESEYFVQDYSRLRDPQLIRLNFTYRFGKLDTDLFKRKSKNGDQGGSDNMQQF
ncbi:TonB-dependent receptor domain-containing protein [Chitinophagaceae bacterium MMS25-I14]